MVGAMIVLAVVGVLVVLWHVGRQHPAPDFDPARMWDLPAEADLQDDASPAAEGKGQEELVSLDDMMQAMEAASKKLMRPKVRRQVRKG